MTTAISIGCVHVNGSALLTQYRQYLQDTRKSATCRIYLGVLDRWLRCTADPLNPSRDEILAWLRARRQCLAKTTVNLELTAVRAFYKWLHRYGWTERDLATLLPKGCRPPQRLARYLDIAQIDRLLAAPDPGSWVGQRDRALLRLLYEIGLRAGELAGLGLGDVALEARLLHVAGRFVPFSPALRDLLAEWMRIRRYARPGNGCALFVTRSGRPCAGARAIWEIVSRYVLAVYGMRRGYERVSRTARRRPWSGGAGTQLVRSSCAVALIERGMDLRAVQELLGHASVRSTARYRVGADLAILKRERAKLRAGVDDRTKMTETEDQ